MSDNTVNRMKDAYIKVSVKMALPGAMVGQNYQCSHKN